VPFASAATALRELFHVAYWLVRTYAKGAKPAASLAFSRDALPRTATIPAATLAELQAAAQRFVDAAKASEEAEAQRQASEAGRQVLEEELAALRAEVAAAKAANARVPDAHDYDEGERASAWHIHDRPRREGDNEDIPTNDDGGRGAPVHRRPGDSAERRPLRPQSTASDGRAARDRRRDLRHDRGAGG